MISKCHVDTNLQKKYRTYYNTKYQKYKILLNFHNSFKFSRILSLISIGNVLLKLSILFSKIACPSYKLSYIWWTKTVIDQLCSNDSSTYIFYILPLSNNSWLWLHDNFARTSCKNPSFSYVLANFCIYLKFHFYLS